MIMIFLHDGHERWKPVSEEEEVVGVVVADVVVADIVNSNEQSKSKFNQSRFRDKINPKRLMK